MARPSATGVERFEASQPAASESAVPRRPAGFWFTPGLCPLLEAGISQAAQIGVQPGNLESVAACRWPLWFTLANASVPVGHKTPHGFPGHAQRITDRCHSH